MRGWDNTHKLKRTNSIQCVIENRLYNKFGNFIVKVYRTDNPYNVLIKFPWIEPLFGSNNINRLTSFMFLYNRSLFLSRKPKMYKKLLVCWRKKVYIWVTVPDIVVSFTHNAVGDLPGIMQETEISPLQCLTRHFVSQFVPVVKEVKRDRVMKSRRLYRLNPPSLFKVGSPTSHQSAERLINKVTRWGEALNYTV